MPFEYVRKLPEIVETLKETALDEPLREIKRIRDEEIAAVFKGESEKFILIIGPCSADNEDTVCEYINRLRKVQDKVQDKLLLIPRIYTNKPRTTGIGYKGMAHQPDPQEAPNIVEGIKAIRKMHLRCFRETRLTAADEMLYPGNSPLLEDVLSYVAIGARSVENQQHRLTASGLDIPCGMKNPTSGDLQVMLNSVLAAQVPHMFIYNSWEVTTPGNALSHAIVRGAVDHYGRCVPNYHYEDLMLLADMYNKSMLKNPALIVDVNHANSNKNFKEQPRIAMQVMDSTEKSGALKKLIKGLMIESYLEEGRADAGSNKPGQSITDACLGWNDTEKLIQEIADKV